MHSANIVKNWLDLAFGCSPSREGRNIMKGEKVEEEEYVKLKTKMLNFHFVKKYLYGKSSVEIIIQITEGTNT